MRASVLPSILSPESPYSPISMERALNQIRKLLESYLDDAQGGPFDDAVEDSLRASLDDVGVMLSCIERGELS